LSAKCPQWANLLLSLSSLTTDAFMDSLVFGERYFSFSPNLLTLIK